MLRWRADKIEPILRTYPLMGDPLTGDTISFEIHDRGRVRGGRSAWTLPVNGSSYNCNFSHDGSTNTGYDLPVPIATWHTTTA